MEKGYIGYEEIKVESFWGAIASIIFFQIFGYLIFQSFISYLDNLFMIFYGSIWLLVFLFFQYKMMSKIRGFLSKKSAKTATLSLRQKDDWTKFILTLIFIVILILFIFGFYPFPQKEYDIFHLVMFYIFSLGVSSIFSIIIQKRIPQTKELKYQGSLGGGIVVGIMFLLLAYFFDIYGTFSFFNFYFIGMVGFGVIMICLTIWLLQDQIK
jgi:hypothetical protein